MFHSIPHILLQLSDIDDYKTLSFLYFSIILFSLHSFAAESSDALDELEWLAASCDTDESRESSEGDWLVSIDFVWSFGGGVSNDLVWTFQFQ